MSPAITEPVLRHAAVEFPRSERYACVAMIGQGGAGVIYRAVDRELAHEVALKVLRTRGSGSVARLKSEFRARADLHHPNLLQLFDLVITPDHAFFTMELVDTVDFLDWIWRGVRPTGGAIAADGAPQRLASAMCDVVSGLVALHGAGLVHFDVKPGNILIDHVGRARLADFGLSTEFRTEAGAPARDAEGAGTPYYMAPERRRGGIITPASDLYSVGATLLEALTGSPQLDPDGLRDDLPPLLALARRLMAADPGARPTARDALQALHALAGAGVHTVVVPELAPRPASEPPFVGRQAQLEAMQHTFECVDDEATATIHVHGPSGIGKTALVRRFLAGVRARHPDAVILRGRCHPYEQIAFCGIDRVVDGLSDYLRSELVSSDGIAPRGLAALVRLFPSLPSRVDPAMVSIDAGSSLRLLGFSALRELLLRVAATRPLVVWIDDLQWIDDDTLEVLHALQNLPRTTLIFTYRLDATGTTSRVDLLRRREQTMDPTLRSYCTDIPLGTIDIGDLELLFRTLAPEVSPDTCKELAAAADGYPIFARVLGVPDAALPGSAERSRAGSLAARLNGIVDALPAAQRVLFDTIAVAPGPVAMPVVIHAARTEQPLPSLRALEQLGIVRRTSRRGAIRVLPFHDRLRQARLEHIDPDERTRIHRALATSHEQLTTFDFEALTHHHYELDDHDAAGRYAILAGDRARASLAFGAAASYYARAIEWLPDRKEPWELVRKLAECQANQGHSNDAGSQFELAARTRAEALGPGPETIHLQLRAAEQMLRSGRIPDGYRIMRDVLSALGVTLPTSHRGAIVRSALLRARLILRGTRFAPHTETDLDDRARLRMDALWMASTSLAHVNYPLADVLLLHHGRSALSAGEPSRILRFLTYEAAAEVTLGSRYFDRRSAALLAQAQKVLPTVPNDYNTGWVHASRSAIAFFRADWRGAIAEAETAERHLLRHGVGTAWERSVAHQYWLFALALTAQVAKLEERRRIALDDALARRDRLAESHCRSGYTSLLWLFRDDLSGAQAERAATLGAVHWHHRDRASARRWPEDSFGTPDYHALLAEAHLELYGGAAVDAHTRVEQAWPFLERALLLRVQFVGVDLRFLRARCALAASHHIATAGTAPARGPDAAALRRIAARERARIAHDRNAAAMPYQALLAGLLWPASRRARDRLEAAAQAFDELAMAAHAAAARFRLGELLGGSEGSELRRCALDSLSAQGAVRPSQIIEMLAPAPVTSGAPAVR